ncbi:preprotein translocase [Thiocystis minor]|uniref:tyrosine-type recombinase/integrase n=1 Tax=Thiocystis minor TaxID=61597 RepID=UPI001914427F|nr:integrase family protein [Thiocystis minor]MBK5962893.1 preprotein translocase [Thiocystis minor]
MASIKLTAGRIRDISHPPPGKQIYLWDSDAPGLGVRTTSRSKAFIFNSRVNDKQVRVAIGDVRTLDIDKARAEARRLQMLIDQGTDPRDHKAEQLARVTARKIDAKRQADAADLEAQRQAVTVRDAWQAYLVDRSHAWCDRYRFDHTNLAREGGEAKKRGKTLTNAGPLAPLMTMRLIEITAATLRTWLKSETAVRPTQARHAFGAFKTFLGWCEEQPSLQGIAEPAACEHRAVKELLPAKRAKDDVLQREQLPSWFAAVRRLDNPVIAAYLQTLLLTGARRNEIATLTWANVDFQWNSLTIRDKVEGERIIPLTPYVASLLSALPRRNEWVFSSPAAAAGYLQEPRIPHNRALTTAGLPALSLHGLRRSFGTLSEWVEMPVGIVAQIQGHKPSATAEKHYRRRPLDLLRQWHTNLEGWILEQAGIPQPTADRTEAPLRRVK